QVRAFLALGYSWLLVTLVCCNQAKALRLASNSTGSVITEKTTVRAKRAIPSNNRVGLPLAAINTPISSTRLTIVELNCTAGTSLLLRLSQAYAVACCT